MISSTSNLYTDQDRPMVGEQVAYAAGGGTKLVGYGRVLRLVMSKRGTWSVTIHLNNAPSSKETRVSLSSLRRVGA